MLTYQKLSSEQVADIYHQHMQQDFPPAEVKPLAVLYQLMEQGLYEPYGWFDENGNLVKTANADGTTEELIVEKYSPNRTPLIAKFGDETITFEYDQNGNEIKKATTHVDGKTSVRTKEYDSHGRLILLKSDEIEHLIAYDSKGRKVFDGTNQGDANHFVYSDDGTFTLVRYSNENYESDMIMENVIKNGKKNMCITYKYIK